MDIQLPGMDGLELTRRLKANSATKGIVILAFTACVEKEDQEKARAAGCDGYIAKPIGVDALRGLIFEAPRAAASGGVNRNPSFLSKRQLDGKRRSLARGARHLDGSPVSFQNLTNDIEPEPEAGHLHGCGALEAREDAGVITRIDSDTVIRTTRRAIVGLDSTTTSIGFFAPYFMAFERRFVTTWSMRSRSQRPFAGSSARTGERTS